MRLRPFVFATAALYLMEFGAAHAQQPTPVPGTGYVPIVIDERTYNDLINYIGEIPTRYGALLINSLTQMQREAQIRAATAAAKPAEPKKD